MENIHSLDECLWVTRDPIDLESYFGAYQELRDHASGGVPYNKQVNRNEAIKHIFPAFEKMEGSSSSIERKVFANSERDATSSPEEVEQVPNMHFDLAKMEADCSIDLLSVDFELPVEDPSASGLSVKHSGSVTNWYAGTFQDGIVPPGGEEKLMTLKEQAVELSKRAYVKDYARLRYRLLKYFSTVRMITDEDNCPEPTWKRKYEDLGSLRDIVLNIRIQRPYHKRVHAKKASNRFPKHSQELLLLGSQMLTDLRDHITCINDLGISQDLSDDPQMHRLAHIANNSVLYPSGFFYINGVLYNDTRHPNAKLYSENVLNWSRKYTEAGKLETALMQETKLIDLKLRIGFPYVYMHQGNCEHLITVTDVRLHHPSDPQDPLKYPLLRGQASKLSVRCLICQFNLANWIVVNEIRAPIPNAHLCDTCMKELCYDSRGRKVLPNIRVYPFIDEFLNQQKKKFKCV